MVRFLLFAITLVATSASAIASPIPPVTALAYRPDSKQVFVGRSKEVLVFDVASGDLVGKLPGQGSKVTSLACHPNGRLLAVASGEPGQVGLLRVYNLPSTGTPNSAYDTIQPLHAIDAHTDLIHQVAFSPDGKLLATCSYDRLITLWELHSEAARHQLLR